MAGDVSSGISQFPELSLWERSLLSWECAALLPSLLSSGEPHVCFHVLAEGTFSSAAAKSDSQWPSVTVWTSHGCHFWALLLQWGTRLCQEEPHLPCSLGKWQNEVFASKTEGHFYFFFESLFSLLLSTLECSLPTSLGLHLLSLDVLGVQESEAQVVLASLGFCSLWCLFICLFCGFFCFCVLVLRQDLTLSPMLTWTHNSPASASGCWTHWCDFLAYFSSVRPLTCFSVYSDWDDLG